MLRDRKGRNTGRMKDLKTALELRNRMKKKKPEFIKQDAYKKDKLKKNWRQPKGRHSKMRLKLKGHKFQPSMGYSSPRIVRGLTRQGLKEVNVHSLDDLNGIQKDEGVMIGGTVGLRKKINILKKAKELKVTVLNIKNIDEFIKKSEEKFLAKKEESKQREEDKKKSKEEAVKRAEEKKKEEEKKTEEEQKKEAEDRSKEEARKRSMQQAV